MKKPEPLNFDPVFKQLDDAYNAAMAGSLGPDATQQPAVEQSDDQTQRAEFIRIYGRQAFDMGMKMPSFKKAKWPQRFEIAEGKRERGE